MGGRHTALLVEDEPQMAAELGELLESLGHAHIHAGNKEDAERLVEEGEFCYVLLDLQIKANADSIKAHVEAGQSLLELIRERYPRRNDEGKHRLQILVMSGHAKEHYYVVKALQEGADDFIIKPVGESKPPFKDKIQDALRRSGRDNHERCAALMREARAIQGPAAEAAPATGPVRLAITGLQEGKRMEVKVGDKAVLLTNASFLMLMSLVAGRLSKAEGWVHKNDLGAKAEQGWKGISRLKEELAPHLPPKAAIIENDKSGSYRLHAGIEITGVDVARLESAGDARIEKLAAEIGRLQSGGRRSRRP
ncbi:MAG TPA: response regulator [Myxococcales bacterium]|nr:response regulator [Myxococcales bacterium]